MPKHPIPDHDPRAGQLNPNLPRTEGRCSCAEALALRKALADLLFCLDTDPTASWTGPIYRARAALAATEFPK